MSTWQHDGITYYLDRSIEAANRHDPASGIGHHWEFTGEFTPAGVPLVTPVGTGDEDLIGSTCPLTSVILSEGPLRQPDQPDPQHRVYLLTMTDHDEAIRITGVTRFSFTNRPGHASTYRSTFETWSMQIDPARFVSLLPATADEGDEALEDAVTPV